MAMAAKTKAMIGDAPANRATTASASVPIAAMVPCQAGSLQKETSMVTRF